jgi:UTP--glucose-1-phosphate uridylyltransferase
MIIETDAMRLMVKENAMYGVKLDGVRYDIGNKLDFIKTNIIYGLEHDEIGESLREWLIDFVEKLKREERKSLL